MKRPSDPKSDFPIEIKRRDLLLGAGSATVLQFGPASAQSTSQPATTTLAQAQRFGSNLIVDNQLTQDIHVFPYERPGWVVADVLLDIGLFAVGVGEIKSVITTAQLPAEISTAADLLKFLNIARQLVMGLIGTSSRSAEAAESIIKAFLKNTIVVPAGQSQTVSSEGVLSEIFSASGWGGLLGAATMDLAIMTEDQRKLVNFTTNPDETWTVDQSAARTPTQEYPWDGEATTTSRLGMTTLGEETWVAGRTAQSTGWSVPLKGGIWLGKESLSNQTADGPGLASFANQLIVAGRGAGSDESLWFASYGSTGWNPPQAIPGAASFVGPVLADFQGRLHAFYRGAGTDQSLWTTSYDGSSWAPQAKLSGFGSTIGPGAAVFLGKLFLAWKGAYEDQRLWFSSFDGTQWAPQAMIEGVGSTVGPSLAVFQNALYAAWRGADSDESIWYSSTTDGVNWAPQKVIPGVGSSVGPAMAADATRLYAAWRGAGPDDTVWWTEFDGQTWATQHHVSALEIT